MMIDKHIVLESLSRAVVAKVGSDHLRLSTHCLYPSNATVSVVIKGGLDEFIVSDDGGAIDEIASSGVRDRITDRQIRGMVKRQGLKVENGAIYSPVVSLSALPAAILLVANASKELADWGTSHLRVVVTRDFKLAVSDLLQRHFHDALKTQKIVGHSNKPHTFSNVIFLSGDRRLLVDPVINDPSSINARLASNIDVKMANDPKIDQIIVFDDQQEWSSSDLRLLQVAAPTVPFSLAEREVMRRAA
jgi:hypothetical protein